jgi:aminoglycoside phosphotransferase (APT) family kinase protein
LLGIPGIVVSFVAGNHIVSPPDPLRWAENLARTLVRIHALPCDSPAECLLDGNSEALWFAGDELAEPLLSHEDGPLLWRLIRELRPQLRPVPSRLGHVDYWPGNLLWHDDQISAVLDWEEASCGDPGYDVAYAEMHLHLLGLATAAQAFLEVYEREAGHRTLNLGFWGLAAAVRALPDPTRLLPQYQALGMAPCAPEVLQTRFRQFIALARRRAAGPGEDVSREHNVQGG